MKRQRVHVVGADSGGQLMHTSLDWFELPKKQSIKDADTDAWDADVKVDRYTVRRFSCGEGEYVFFAAPKTWSTAEIMRELWRGYRADKGGA